MSEDKFYTGSCYIGVVGSETDNGFCRDSIHNIQRRPGDGLPVFVRATKGYEARQIHLNKFIDSEHAFILLLDHDMLFSPDTLERLRAHGRAYVTGTYMRRTYNPIAPVWFEDNPELAWPYMPDTRVLPKDQLHPIGASGWGCILIHREVVTAVRELLKGEPEVLEDDMDLWPYDLEMVVKTLRALDCLAARPVREWSKRQHKALRAGIMALRQELRPLRGMKDIVGSDIRFPFFARVAGYQLWLDPNVRPGHMLNYPLSADDFEGLPDPVRQSLVDNISLNVTVDRQKMAQNLARLTGGQTV